MSVFFLSGLHDGDRWMGPRHRQSVGSLATWWTSGVPSIRQYAWSSSRRGAAFGADLHSVERNHSTNFGMPSLIFVVGLYPSFARDFEMSAISLRHVAGLLRLPIDFSFFAELRAPTSEINSRNSTVRDSPRLIIS